MEFLSLKVALKDPACLQCYMCVASLETCSITTKLDSALPNPTTPSLSMLLTPNTSSTERTLLKNRHCFAVVTELGFLMNCQTNWLASCYVLVGLFGRALWPVFRKLYLTAAHVRAVCLIPLCTVNQ